MAREIPGFYYDEAKGKYFAIQRNHAAPTTSSASAYNADSVKRRRLEDDTRKEHAHRLKLRKKYVSRAQILAKPCVRASLSREQGQARMPCLRQYTRQAVLTEWASQDILTAFRPAAVRAQNPQTMTGFAYDDFSNTILTPSTDGLNSSLLGYGLQEGAEISSQRTPTFDTQSIRHFASCQSTITSINIDRKSRLLLATWHSPQSGSNLFLTSLLPDGSYDMAQMWRVESEQGYPLDLLTSALAPPGSKYSFVIGTSDGLVTADRAITALSMNKFETEEPNTTDVFAVEFLPCLSPSVLLSGQRNGCIAIFDDRLKNTRTSARIQHPSAVSHIMQVDGSHIIVAGLHSTLCQYDLRYCSDRPRKQVWRDRNPSRGQGKVATTTVLQYPEHDNQAYTDLGFDVDTEAGVVAAAQSDYKNTVKVFSLQDGKALQTLGSIEAGSHTQKFPESSLPVKAVSFEEDRVGAIKSLWVARGAKITRVGW